MLKGARRSDPAEHSEILPRSTRVTHLDVNVGRHEAHELRHDAQVQLLKHEGVLGLGQRANLGGGGECRMGGAVA